MEDEQLDRILRELHNNHGTNATDLDPFIKQIGLGESKDVDNMIDYFRPPGVLPRR